MDEIDRHGVGSGIDWMNGCDRKKCPCGCEPCQSGLCRCYSSCRGDELGYSNNFDLQYPAHPRLPPLDLMFEDEENDNENVGWGFDSGNSWLKTLGTAHLNS